jgi:hypothetical protein
MKRLMTLACFLMALPLCALTLTEAKGEYQVDEETSLSLARLAATPGESIHRKLAGWKGSRLVLNDKEIIIKRGDTILQRGLFRVEEGASDALTLIIDAARGPIKLKISRKNGGLSCDGIGAPGQDVIWKVAP